MDTFTSSTTFVATIAAHYHYHRHFPPLSATISLLGMETPPPLSPPQLLVTAVVVVFFQCCWQLLATLLPFSPSHIWPRERGSGGWPENRPFLHAKERERKGGWLSEVVDDDDNSNGGRWSQHCWRWRQRWSLRRGW
ncbi:hypothetical protein Syun_023390 [Stephania yunnanensis]|uniref:Uncharacterized protein n=1 Tax=Stephania yunnanensis TaxID=152371 RepID=A0AAP0FNV7_9MAGN